jgi:hypothetical protein
MKNLLIKAAEFGLLVSVVIAVDWVFVEISGGAFQSADFKNSLHSGLFIGAIYMAIDLIRWTWKKLS